ncbi:MAG: DUF5329 family protein [Candidatus Omnitrophica bacterium]|nr:DUF5329 family protein [Candidatus Omnitrophota bacterium]
MISDRRLRTAWTIVLMLLMLILPAISVAGDEASIGLGYTERSMAFKEYENSQNSQGEIKYLIKLVKFSNMRIVKAGKEFNSTQAARYLLLKLKTTKQDILSTEQFIDEFASVTPNGEPIYIIDRKGMNYPARHVLYSELRRLRNQKSANAR